MALTRRQREVLDVIRAFIEKNGYSPSLEEIGKALGLSSVATVHKHVTHLVDKGLARRVWNQNRSIEIVDESARRPCVDVPLVGLLSASGVAPAPPGADSIAAPPDLAAGRGKLVALRVLGSLPASDGIRDGDVLLLEDRRSVKDGETVVAAIDGGETVICTAEREGGSLRLSDGANPSRSQLVPHERVHLHGIVVALLRRYAHAE